MKTIRLDQRIFEVTEAELRRLFGLTDEWSLTDAKTVERAKDPRRPDRLVLGIRFTHKRPDVTQVNLEFQAERAAGARDEPPHEAP